jgi:lysophospholipase L1-like esterase
MIPPANAAPRPRRFARRACLAVLWLVLNLVVLELATRAFFAARIGPRVLLYGTPWHHKQVVASASAPNPLARSSQFHENRVGDYKGYVAGESAYSKFFPNEEKWTESPDRRTPYRVRINNQGFRGDDFAVEKAPGTIRILTMGASSTFGYHDRDDETYPYLLGRELNADAPEGTRFEVINFAIPHATTDNVLAMFLNEGVALDPDVVTFYEGANDAVVIEPRSGEAAESWRQAISRRVLLAALLERLVPRFGVADPEWWWSDELAERRRAAFIANLDRLAAECHRRGITLIVATQQLKSDVVPPGELHGVTYEQEVALVREKLARGEIGPRLGDAPAAALDFRLAGTADPADVRTINQFGVPRVLLVHARLMAAERRWAPDAGVPLVDVIRELDGDRDLLVNWVHLRPEANAKIAHALAAAIRTELARRPSPTTTLP